jgi:hypothetical protein
LKRSGKSRGRGGGGKGPVQSPDDDDGASRIYYTLMIERKRKKKDFIRHLSSCRVENFSPTGQRFGYLNKITYPHDLYCTLHIALLLLVQSTVTAQHNTNRCLLLNYYSCCCCCCEKRMNRWIRMGLVRWARSIPFR